MIKGVIWTCDRAGDGIERLKYIRDRYMFAGISPRRETYSRQSSWVEFDNGDFWRVMSATESSRGVRSNYAWIDARISDEFVRTVILRTLTYPFEPRQYEFFLPGW